MSMPKRNRTPGKTQPIVFVFMLGFLLILIVLAVALGSGGGGTPWDKGGRENPQLVNDRVISAMQKQDPQNIWQEMSPDLQTLFPIEAFQQAQQQAITELGNVTKVEIIKAPAVLPGTEWEGKWADGLIRITRDKGVKTYIVRYYLENGEWFLFGTIEQ